MRGEGANEKIHDVLTQVTLSHRGLYRPTYLYFPNRTVIEKWMEETTNPMRFMQPTLSRKQHECPTLLAVATHV